MKVLQVNCVYEMGSTGKIVAEIHSELVKRGIQSVVCYGRGPKADRENIYKTCGEFYAKTNHLVARLRGQLFGGCNLSTARLISVIRQEKPDVVHLQCINGYFVNIPKLITWLKKNHIKTVLTLHAEFMFTANCGHARGCEKWKTGCGKCPQLRTELKSFGIDGTHRSWKKMYAAFSGFQKNLIVTSVSPWLMSRAEQSPILKDKRHSVVMNGLNTEIFHRYNTEILRRKYPKDVKIVLFATTCLTDDINDIKGGHYIIELAKSLEEEPIQILVAGDYDKTLNLPVNMVMLGRIEEQNVLAEYYSMADVTVLASQRETFSMVTVESLCCGTPVVGFEAGGPESIALPKYSIFVRQGDVDGLKDALFTMLQKKVNSELLEREARQSYSGEKMTNEYIAVYKSLLEK